MAKYRILERAGEFRPQRRGLFKWKDLGHFEIGYCGGMYFVEKLCHSKVEAEVFIKETHLKSMTIIDGDWRAV
jgi:hypothetical protein